MNIHIIKPKKSKQALHQNQARKTPVTLDLRQLDHIARQRSTGQSWKFVSIIMQDAMQLNTQKKKKKREGGGGKEKSETAEV